MAAALTEAGIRAFRETPSGARRGMFCGMGVCQECLVEIDGQPNRRACMTPAAPRQAIKTQTALPQLGGAAPEPKPAQRLSPDVLVIGGGAGGLNAAIAAAEAGADVLVLDERKVAGGQFYKQTAEALGRQPLDAQQARGADLVARAHASGARIVGGAEVWGAFDGPLVFAEVGGTALVVSPKTIVVATGAYERPAMVPGWDLPGVMTTGAAQTLWRSYRTLPGQRVAICGSGPLNAQVALELAAGGADVVLVAEAAPAPWRSIGAVARMWATSPGLAAKGAAMLAGLKRRGVKMRYGTELVRIAREGDELAATFRSASGETAVSVDTVCMNYGFQPQNEVLRLLGADMRYDRAFDQLRPARSDAMETSVAAVFAVGDCCGLGGAPAAVEEGAIAGAAAARLCGRDAADPRDAHRRLARHRSFQDALWTLYRAGAPALPSADALACRCEEVSGAMLDDTFGDDPANRLGDIGSVKRATRLGMGRCQGRYCAPALARRMAADRGTDIGDLSFFAPRAPIKPVAIATVLAANDVLAEHEAPGDT